jgi:hypothetical protein
MRTARRRRARHIFLAATLVLVWASTTDAQPPAGALDALESTLRPRSPVEVTRGDGTRVKGRFETVEQGKLMLVVGERRVAIEERDVRKVVSSRHDPLWNGPLIGAAAGALLGLIPDYYDDCEECHDSLYVSMAVGAGVGLLVDVLRRERQTVYQAPAGGGIQFGLAVGRGRMGLAARVSWD